MAKSVDNTQATEGFRGFRGKKRLVTHGVAVAGLLGLGVAGVALSLPAEANFEAPTKASPSKQSQGSPDRQQAEDKVPVDVYSRVMRLREDIALTNDDLAALGLTEAQAGDVLTRLVEWVEANQAAMIAADNRAKDARRELALLQRRIRTGEADAREAGRMSDLYRAVAEAEAACEALCGQAGSHAVAPAPEDTRSQWAQARANKRLPVELRHVAGLDTQRLRNLLTDAARTEQRRSAETATRDGVSAIETGLTLSERESYEAARQNIRANLPGVAAAEAEVLPLPASLRDDEAMLAAMDREAQEKAE